MTADRTQVRATSWDDVLAAVEQDVEQTAALLREPVHVNPEVGTQPAPATVLLPLAEHLTPPLATMPPVPPELAERIDELRNRVVDLQAQLGEAMTALRAVSGRPSVPALPVYAPTPAHYFDSRL